MNFSKVLPNKWIFAGAIFTAVSFHAQNILPFAVVDSKSVYANARTDGKRVMERMAKDDVFLIVKTSAGNPEWWEIKYNFKKDDEKPFERITTFDNDGIINKERIIYIDQLPKYTPSKLRNSIIFTDSKASNLPSNKRNKITIDIAPYDATYRKQEKDADGKITLLDKDYPWGIAGKIPEKMTQLKSVRIQMNGVGAIFPRDAIKNMFQPTTDFDKMGVYELNDRILFFYMKNGDPEDPYTTIWTIKDSKVIKQVIIKG